MSLRWSDEVLPVARAVLAAERIRLRDAAVPSDLVLVGGSSAPRTLTRGDVDLHLRLPPDRFADAVERLRSLLSARRVVRCRRPGAGSPSGRAGDGARGRASGPSSTVASP